MTHTPRPVSRFRDELVTLSHGGGGKASQSLIENVFVQALANPLLNPPNDSAILDIGGVKLAFTTDSYTVDPVFFPGGDIGSLAVNGTINDLCAAGAEPLYLSVAVILEEGFPVADLRRIVGSIATAAKQAAVQVVTGDTKVVQRGKVDKIFINTTGIGRLHGGQAVAPSAARPGDRVLLSGQIGEHGITILAARGDLGLEVDLKSDTAPMNGLLRVITRTNLAIHCMKDPTRGGIASTLNEIATASGVGIEIDEQAIPILPQVRGACEILGLDPLYVANEGKMIIIAPADAADAIVAAMRSHPLGESACIIGEVVEEHPAMVVLRTTFGGCRVVDMPVGEVLPRIC